MLDEIMRSDFRTFADSIQNAKVAFLGCAGRQFNLALSELQYELQNHDNKVYIIFFKETILHDKL